jgi:hypothetical protein
MVRTTSVVSALLAGLCLAPPLWATDNPKPSVPARLSAEQIVDKHVAARGGLPAWRAVETLTLSGKMDAGEGDSAARSARYARRAMAHPGARAERASAQAGEDSAAAQHQVQLPFTLQMKRPHKSRLQIEFSGRSAVQVFDGTNGWKVRPFLNRNDVESFTPQESKSEAARGYIDGPLVDYAAKGAKLTLEGSEAVEGRDAYKLKLTSKDGTVQHVWIDTKSFLDVKIEGVPRRMDGRMHNVSIVQRDFRMVQGLMIPFVLETTVDGYREKHQVIIEKASVNAALNDALFTKPGA